MYGSSSSNLNSLLKYAQFLSPWSRFTLARDSSFKTLSPLSLISLYTHSTQPYHSLLVSMPIFFFRKPSILKFAAIYFMKLIKNNAHSRTITVVFQHLLVAPFTSRVFCAFSHSCQKKLAERKFNLGLPTFEPITTPMSSQCTTIQSIHVLW